MSLYLHFSPLMIHLDVFRFHINYIIISRGLRACHAKSNPSVDDCSREKTNEFLHQSA